MRSRWRRARSGVSRWFAPGATAIWLRPSGSTEISATPVGTSVVRSIGPGGRRASARAAASRSPIGSAPSSVTKATSAPSRRAATAWFAPLPPGDVVKVPPETVSPTPGSFGTDTVKSRFELPITQTVGTSRLRVE